MENGLDINKDILKKFLYENYSNFVLAKKSWALILSGVYGINKSNTSEITDVLKESFDFFKTGHRKKSNYSREELTKWANWIKSNLEKDKWAKYVENYENVVRCNYSKYMDTLSGNELKYLIISEAPPIKWSKGDILKTNYIFDINNKSVGVYRDEPFLAFEGKNNQTILDVFKNQKVGFLDLLPIPIPLSSTLRSRWASEEKFRINNKALTVLLLEWAIEYFLIECNKRKIILAADLKICFMMPGNTSMSIFNYFETKPKEGLFFGSVFIPNDVIVKTNHGLKERYFKQLSKTNLPLYKINGCGSGNIPKKELIQNAFDLLIE